MERVARESEYRSPAYRLGDDHLCGLEILFYTSAEKSSLVTVQRLKSEYLGQSKSRARFRPSVGQLRPIKNAWV
jgi:hypothetical protein